MVTHKGRKSQSGKRDTGGGKRWFYLALAAVLIAGIGTLSYMSVRPSGAVSQVDTTLPPIPNQGHVMGSDSAPHSPAHTEINWLSDGSAPTAVPGTAQQDL